MLLDHIVLLASLARQIQPALYLELGVFEGDCITRIKPYASQVIGVDDVHEVPGMDIYKMTTEEFFANVLPGIPRIDMAFIDADHTAESAFRDFEEVLAHASPGAVIALHDTYPEDLAQTAPGYCGDSYKVPAMIHEAYPHLEIFTIPVPPGLTLVRNASPGWCRITS